MFLSRALRSQSREQWETRELQIGACSMQGMRPENEDRYSIVSRLTLQHTKAQQAYAGCDITMIALFDGHSGRACAEFCKRQIEERVSRLEDPFDTTQLSAMFLELDQDFLRIDPVKHAVSGATGILVLVRPPDKHTPMMRVLTAHVGDSRAMTVSTTHSGRAHNSKCRVIALSTDHKPMDDVEEKRIRKAGGFVFYNRVCGQLALSRAFGDSPYKAETKRSALKQQVIAVPTFTKSIIDPGQLLIVCCDGPLERMDNETLGTKCVEELEKATNVAFGLAQIAGRTRTKSGETKRGHSLEFKIRTIRQPARLPQLELDLSRVAAQVCLASIDAGSMDNHSLVLVRYKYDGEDRASDGSDEFKRPWHASVFEPERLPRSCWSALQSDFMQRYIGEALVHGEWTLNRIFNFNDVWSAPAADRARFLKLLPLDVTALSDSAEDMMAVAQLESSLRLGSHLEATSDLDDAFYLLSDEEHEDEGIDSVFSGQDEDDEDEDSSDTEAVEEDNVDGEKLEEQDDEQQDDEENDTEDLETAPLKQDVANNESRSDTLFISSKKRARPLSFDDDGSGEQDTEEVKEPVRKRPKMTKEAIRGLCTTLKEIMASPVSDRVPKRSAAAAWDDDVDSFDT